MATVCGPVPTSGEPSTTMSDERMTLALPAPLFATTRRGEAQSTIAVPVHTPVRQTSVVVQAFASLQVPPSLIGVATHASVVSLHEPLVHDPERPVQSRCAAAVQAPVRHVSPMVQKRPSSH